MACTRAVSGSYESGRPRLPGVFRTMTDKILDLGTFRQYGTKINGRRSKDGTVFFSAGLLDGDPYYALRIRRRREVSPGRQQGQASGGRQRLPGGEPDGPGPG